MLLSHHLRRCPNTKTTLAHRVSVFAISYKCNSFFVNFVANFTSFHVLTDVLDKTLVKHENILISSLNALTRFGRAFIKEHVTCYA